MVSGGIAIGVININRILDESARGKALVSKLARLSNEYDAQAADVNQRLQQARDNVQAAGAAGNADKLFKAQRDVQLLELELRQLHERGQTEVGLYGERYRARVLQEVQPVINAYAEEQGLDLVLIAPGAQLAYVRPTLDVTEAVLARFDASAAPKS